MSWAGVAVGVGSAVAGYSGSKKQAKSQKPLIDAQKGLANQQIAISKETQPYIGQFYSRAKEGFDPAFSYYNALAGGDRNAIMASVAPQLSDIGNRYSTLTQASRELAPRSGAGAAFNTDLAYRAADEGQRVINTERASAFPNLAKMGATASDIAAGAAGVSTGAGTGASGLLSGVMGANNNLAASRQQSYTDIAKGLYSAWQAYQAGKGGGTTAPAGGSGSGNGK